VQYDPAAHPGPVEHPDASGATSAAASEGGGLVTSEPRSESAPSLVVVAPPSLLASALPVVTLESVAASSPPVGCVEPSAPASALDESSLIVAASCG